MPTRAESPSIRTVAAVLAAKGAALGSRTLRRGGGTALSGLAGLSLNPGLTEELAKQLGHGCILVTGTNGKTTTSMLVAKAVATAGLQPLANTSGSNLARGIASTLALAATPSGRLNNADDSLGVFEVDEAALPLLVPALRPRAIVFLNLFRDQLDRFGEVDAVAALWRDLLARTPLETVLVLNADDPTVAGLGDGRPSVVYFGVDDRRLGSSTLDHASDARSCLCGAPLLYERAYAGHVGHWRCDACGRARPQPHVVGSGIDLRDGRSTAFDISIAGEVSRVEMKLGGLYNVYNALAAGGAAVALGLPPDTAVTAIRGAGAAFGRQETFDVEGRSVEIYLGKNPAGVNQVIATLMLDEKRRVLLIALNDNIADGRDISWVWDADFEHLAGFFGHVIVSGRRAEEMALRLKYADWPEATMEIVPALRDGLERALELAAPGETLTLLPTYTAMLELRALLARRTGKAAFWR